MTDEYQRVFKGKMGCYNEYPKNANDQILAGLSYIIWIVGVIALVAVKPLSPFLRFHAIQGLALTVVIVISWIVTSFLAMFLIGLLLVPFVFLLHIYGFIILILVVTGHDHRIPFLADWVEKNYV